MNSGKTAGESYWSCYRRARKRSEFDLQLLSEQRQLHNGSSSETESQQDDGEADEVTDNSPETIEACTSIDASHDNHGTCNCDEFASEMLSSDNTGSDSESMSSSDTISYSDSSDEPSLTEQLAVWATECNIPGVAITRLLHILKRYHPFLPCDSRSLQHTCRKYDVKKLDNGGKY